MFCPKCGGLLIPKSDKGKRRMSCSKCKYVDKEAKMETKFREEVKGEKEIEIVDSNKDLEALPQVDVECPQCKHTKSYFWTVQTRAADEPETKFHRCVKCKHTWRDYS